MTGWLLVGFDATRSAAGLTQWIELALEWTKKTAKSSPTKKEVKARSKRARAEP